MDSWIVIAERRLDGSRGCQNDRGYANRKSEEKKNVNLNTKRILFESTNNLPNQIELLSWSQKLRVLRQREVSRKNVSPGDDERVAYRSTRVLRLRMSSFLSPHIWLILIAVLLNLCHGLSRFFTDIYFIQFPPLPVRSAHPGACSAARPSPGELRSIKRLDLSSDVHFLLHRDIMRPSDQH